MLKAIKNHTLFQTFKSLDRHSKAVVWTEPLWGIPFHLYIPFVALYKAALGLSDSQIGLLASLTMLVSIISGLLSGAITDKLGRRLTTLLADLLSWSVPCLIWAFSQNFWWFMVAASFNGLWQISNTSWSCLLVENVEKKHVVNVWQLIYLSGQLVVFFAPLSGMMVRTLDVAPAMRILYLFSFFSMTAKCTLMYGFGGETEQGKRRMGETKDASIISLLAGYGSVTKRLLRSREIVKVMLFTVFLTIGSTAVSTFFGLYATQNLGLPRDILAYLPILRAGVMLSFFFILVRVLDKVSFRKPVLVGITLFVTGQILLILSTRWAGTAAIYPTIFIYIVLEAFGFAMVFPRRDSLMAIIINPQERARMTCIINALVTVIVMPFGFISGILSGIDRRMPFALAIVMMAAAFTLVFFIKINMQQNEEIKLGDITEEDTT
ncbi:MAG: MFS transporter [Defluviitaleaceae bacterium]|nr:MFS transporter [Defluviitaleaceae bacterium]